MRSPVLLAPVALFFLFALPLFSAEQTSIGRHREALDALKQRDEEGKDAVKRLEAELLKIKDSIELETILGEDDDEDDVEVDDPKRWGVSKNEDKLLHQKRPPRFNPRLHGKRPTRHHVESVTDRSVEEDLASGMDLVRRCPSSSSVLLKAFTRTGTTWTEQLIAYSLKNLCVHVLAGCTYSFSHDTHDGHYYLSMSFRSLNQNGVTASDGECHLTFAVDKDKHDQTQVIFTQPELRDRVICRAYQPNTHHAAAQVPKPFVVHNVRDPRDVYVSAFHSDMAFVGRDIDADAQHFFEGLVRGMTALYLRYVGEGAFVVHYDEIRHHTVDVLFDIIEGIGLSPPSSERRDVWRKQLASAVDRFDISKTNMMNLISSQTRRIQKNKHTTSAGATTLVPRSGRIGEHRELLSNTTILWMNDVMRRILPTSLRECYLGNDKHANTSNDNDSGNGNYNGNGNSNSKHGRLAPRTHSSSTVGDHDERICGGWEVLGADREVMDVACAGINTESLKHLEIPI